MYIEHALVEKHQELKKQLQKLSLDLDIHVGQHTFLTGHSHPVFGVPNNENSEQGLVLLIPSSFLG